MLQGYGGVLLDSGKLTWRWNIPNFRLEMYIFIHGPFSFAYVSLPKCS